MVTMANVELKHTTTDNDCSNDNDRQDSQSVYASTMTACEEGGSTQETIGSPQQATHDSSIAPCHLGSSTNPSAVEMHLFNIFDNHTMEQCLSHIMHVDQMWKEIGYSSDKCKEKITSLQTMFIQDFKILAEKERKEYQLYQKKIDQLEMDIETVLNDLEELSDSQLKDMMLSEDCMSNVDESNLLITRVAQLEKLYCNLCLNREKHDQETSAVKLNLKQTFKQLGETPLDHHRHFLNKRLLSSSDIQHLNQLLEPYQSELSHRKEQCTTLAKKISFLAKTVPISVDCALSEDCLKNNFVFSRNNQTKLEQISQVALKSLEVMWQRLNQIVDQLNKIYLLFDISNEKKHRFFEPIRVLLKDNVNKQELDVLMSRWTFDASVTMEEIQQALVNENQQYEELKCQRMKEIIGNVRRQYRQLLEKCLVDHTELETHNEFHFLTIDTDFNDQLLQAHEEKMSQLREYYDKYKDFFGLMTKWRELRQQMTECAQELQQAIIYRNRGGGLQQTLNRQRTIKKKLTQSTHQIETWLQQHISESDHHNPLPFNLFRVEINDLISELNQEKTGNKTSFASPNNRN